MQRENTRRIIRNVAVIGGVILAVLIVFLIIRALIPSGSKPSQTELTNPLINTSTDRGVSMTVRGPIVASENARSYQVDITPTSRSATQFSGYDGTVINKQVYSNSTSAYEQLVYALNDAGMTSERKTSDTDTRGVCPNGQLFTFSLERDTATESSLWTSSCSNARGTLSTRPNALRNLFDRQIPDIAKFSSGL